MHGHRRRRSTSTPRMAFDGDEMRNEPRCHRCKFWDPSGHDADDPIEEQFGDCLRHAPHPLPWQFELMGGQFNQVIRALAKLTSIELNTEQFGTYLAQSAYWQCTRGDEWCGEFEAKKVPKRKRAPRRRKG